MNIISIESLFIEKTLPKPRQNAPHLTACRQNTSPPILPRFPSPLHPSPGNSGSVLPHPRGLTKAPPGPVRSAGHCEAPHAAANRPGRRVPHAQGAARGWSLAARAWHARRGPRKCAARAISPVIHGPDPRAPGFRPRFVRRGAVFSAGDCHANSEVARSRFCAAASRAQTMPAAGRRSRRRDARPGNRSVTSAARARRTMRTAGGFGIMWKRCCAGPMP